MRSRLWSAPFSSKLEFVWVVFRYDKDVSLTDIKTLHEQVADILSYLYPSEASVYIFAKGDFSDEVVKFVEDEKNWIPYWKEGEKDELIAGLSLVKMEGGGRFTVIAMPWLKFARKERLEMATET